jgi:hypothetical protein
VLVLALTQTANLASTLSVGLKECAILASTQSAVLASAQFAKFDLTRSAILALTQPKNSVSQAILAPKAASLLKPADCSPDRLHLPEIPQRF